MPARRVLSGRSVVAPSGHTKGVRTSHPLVLTWRARAEQLAAWGAPAVAAVWLAAAAELDVYYVHAAMEELTLKRAAMESGYSEAHLARLVADGTLENAGKKGSPRIRRGDLPRKPVKRPPQTAEPDLVDRVRRGDGLRDD